MRPPAANTAQVPVVVDGYAHAGDPFFDIECMAEELEVIAAALVSSDNEAKAGRMLERLAARMNDALTEASRTYEIGIEARGSS